MTYAKDPIVVTEVERNDKIGSIRQTGSSSALKHKNI